MDFLIGGLAAAGASLFSNPFDVLKTRMQLQGELQARGKHVIHFRNVFHAAYVVAKNDGILALQKGLAAAILMHCVRNSIRLGLYQGAQQQGLITDQRGRVIWWRSAVIGGICGAAGAFAGSPLFLIKTQLQSYSKTNIAVGYQHTHSGLVGAVKTIFEKHGVKGLWRGGNAVVVRALAGSSAQLSSFAVCKDWLAVQYPTLAKNPMINAFFSSVVGGVFQTICMQPFDLVSTRLYNQGVDKHGKGLLYSGIVDCFYKVAKSEGIFGLYKGVAANYMRLAPHSVLTLVFWDYLKEIREKYLTNSSKNK